MTNRSMSVHSGRRVQFVHGAMFVTCLAISALASATDIVVAGLFTNKALVQIDGGPMQTIGVGQKTKEGIDLVAVESDGAIFEVRGQRVKVDLGRARTTIAPPSTALAQMTADLQGHIFTNGLVNGVPIRFLVDTGATLVVLPAKDAQRIAPDYRKGSKASMNTANGKMAVYRIHLDTVTVGGLTFHGVEAAVTDGDGLPHPLLGMSFLNRTDMKREGDIMTLTKRY